LIPAIGCLSSVSETDKNKLEDVISNLSSSIAKEILNEVKRYINNRPSSPELE